MASKYRGYRKGVRGELTGSGGVMSMLAAESGPLMKENLDRMFATGLISLAAYQYGLRKGRREEKKQQQQEQQQRLREAQANEFDDLANFDIGDNIIYTNARANRRITNANADLGLAHYDSLNDGPLEAKIRTDNALWRLGLFGKKRQREPEPAQPEAREERKEEQDEDEEEEDNGARGPPSPDAFSPLAYHRRAMRPMRLLSPLPLKHKLKKAKTDVF